MYKTLTDKQRVRATCSGGRGGCIVGGGSGGGDGGGRGVEAEKGKRVRKGLSV